MLSPSRQKRFADFWFRRQFS